LIETITDPDGNEWSNSLDVGIFGEEIGDECSFVLFTDSTAYFDPSNVTLNGKRCAINRSTTTASTRAQRLLNNCSP
jgi:hypothetical protein